MDQATAALIVRLTARASVVIFAAALLSFAAGDQHDRRRLHIATRLFLGFIVAHTIHFAAVAWLAFLTGAENIRERDGWAVVMTVAVLFYVAVFVVFRAWGDAAVGRSPSRSLPVTADVAVVAIAAVFLNSYLGRVEQMPIYWLPAVALAGTVMLYFARSRAASLSSLRRRRSHDHRTN